MTNMTDLQRAVIAARDYLRELVADLELNLEAHRAALPALDFDEHLRGLRARLADADAMISSWADNFQ